ncbi:MAG: response regulator transcription factor [Actinomycetales bacterium]|nr:response regulator transcription factor [Actinomycetales bacterium]
MVGRGRSVLVVEDDRLTLGLLAEILTQSGFVVGAAATAAAARRMWDQMDPDAVVLDVDLGPGVNGFDLADAFLARRPELAVLFLSNLPDARFAGRSAASLPQAAGYVRKDRLSDPQALVTALDAVLRGLAAQTPRDDRDPARPLAGLSRTQIEVLRMVAMGLSNQQIAAERGTTTRAVHNVIARAMAAIGAVDSEEGSARVIAAREFIRAAGLPEST